MNVFQTHSHIVHDYSTYIQSFLNISDSLIRRTVENELKKGKLWPEPLIQFNPSFDIYGRLDDRRARYTNSPASHKELPKRLLVLYNQRAAEKRPRSRTQH